MNNLVLTDRNLFTATELVFAKPVYNSEMYLKFLEANTWTQNYFPSLKLQSDNIAPEKTKESFTKKIFESVLGGSIGNYLEIFCMKISDRFWQKKFSNMSREQYLRDMKSDKGVSKHHPNGFRDKVLNEHHRRMELFVNQLHSHSENGILKSQAVYQ